MRCARLRARASAALGVVAFGVSRTLVILGILEGGARGSSSDSSSGGSASDSSSGSGASSRAAARRARRSRRAAKPPPPPRAAAEADDEGELWQREPGQRWLEAGASWLEASGALADAGDAAESWEDEFGGGGEWDTSAAGEEVLVDSGADD